MQIHRVRGSSLKSSLARRILGDNAIVVSQEIPPGGDRAAWRAARGAAAQVGIFPAARARQNPALREAEQRLERQGVSAGPDRAHRRVRARNVPGAPAGRGAAGPARRPGASRGRARAGFAGATGVGKTTSIVKLAKRMRRGPQARAGDTRQRARGAVEQLRARRPLEIPLTVLSAACVRTRDAGPLGRHGAARHHRPPRHDAELPAQLRKSSSGTRAARRAPVLAAPSSRAALEAT